MRILLLMVCGFMAYKNAGSQNMVPNADFEENNFATIKFADSIQFSSPIQCNNIDTTICDHLYKWETYSNGRWIYVSVPTDSSNHSHTWGEIRLFSLNEGKDGRTYLVCRLDTRVQKDSVYYMGGIFKSAFCGSAVIRDFDIAFYSMPPVTFSQQLNDFVLTGKPLQVLHFDDGKAAGTGLYYMWKHFDTTFVAKNAALWLLIGNLSEKKKTTAIYKKGEPEARLWMDSLYLFAGNTRNSFSNTTLTNAAPIVKPVEHIADSIWIGRIYFKTGEDSSTGVLENIIKKLRTYNTQYKLIIAGYTDDEGTEEYNNILSLKRALYVYRKLSAFIKIPCQTLGFGNKKPLEQMKNSAINRRVEVYLLKIR